MDKFLLTLSIATIAIFVSAAIASSLTKREKKQENNCMLLEDDDFGSRYLELEHQLGMDLSRDLARALLWLIDWNKIAVLERVDTSAKKAEPEPIPQLSDAEQEQNRLRFCRWLVVHGKLTDELPQEPVEK